MDHTPEPALVPDGCFLNLPYSPDITVTQGADLEIRFCGEHFTSERPIVACIGPDYITLDQKSCVKVNDSIMLACLEGCDLTEITETTQVVSAVSADGLKLTLTPGFASVTKERCYRSLEQLEGCLDTTPGTPAPRFVILVKDWILQGIAAHRISNGCVRSLGFTVAAGSNVVKTLIQGAVQPDDHISIPSAGIVDAIVQSVRETQTDLGLVQSITLDQSAKTSGCFPGMVADGLLLSFDVESEGSGACQIARLSASKTAKLKPPFGVEVPANANPESFLGHYLFVAQSIVTVAGKPVVRTRLIDSGLLVLKSTVAGSNKLGV
jgi:hypothetical protein